jgi:Polysaccharide pyruvyl transferase
VRYGLLAYRNTENLGDEIQSIAARRFLPRVDMLVERDYLSLLDVDGEEPVALICNGWLTHRPENWPPPDGVVPLLVSMHIAHPDVRVGKLSEPVDAFVLDDGIAEYLRHWGPVGARDLRTLARLEAARVPAYFSGCLTLTLERDADAERGDEVVLVDLPEAVTERVREATSRDVVVVTHRNVELASDVARSQRAEQLLARYQRAHCVITSRLHAALPCLAYGTPVLAIPPTQDFERYGGLESLVRSTTLEGFLSGRAEFDVNSPRPNDLDHLRIRSGLERTVTDWIDHLDRQGTVPRGPVIGPAEREATLLALLAASNRERDRLTAAVDARAGWFGARAMKQVIRLARRSVTRVFRR